MATDPLTDEEEQYDSAADSDFAPDGGPDAVSSADEDDEDDEVEKGRKRKQAITDATGAGADDDVVYENSGDEAIIAKGKKKLKKSKTADDEGGDGGLIKTRAQRAAEKEERRYAANTDPVTIDVDALWKQMLSGKPIVSEATKETAKDDRNESEPTQKSPTKPDASKMIRIKRTYNFAGKVHTEEKMVARDSAEAKLYLASEEGQAAAAAADASPPKRATRKAFRSAFEPVILVDSSARRADLNLGMAARLQAARELQAKKLTTVEKSRMDWAGYVDKEGIKDELALAGRSKHSYAARQEFLARSQAVRDEESRRARIEGRT